MRGNDERTRDRQQAFGNPDCPWRGRGTGTAERLRRTARFRHAQSGDDQYGRRRQRLAYGDARERGPGLGEAAGGPGLRHAVRRRRRLRDPQRQAGTQLGRVHPALPDQLRHQELGLGGARVRRRRRQARRDRQGPAAPAEPRLQADLQCRHGLAGRHHLRPAGHHTPGFPEPSTYSALQAQPGTKFIYSNSGTNWLANALTNAYRQDLRQLTANRLFAPLGLTSNDVRWRTSAGSFPDPVYGLPATDFNGGMLANVNAMARLGYVYLRRGSWDGRQIVSSSYVGLSTGPYFSRIPISALKGHGLLWWNNASGGIASVPRDTYHSLGKNDNLTIVIPSLDMVVVRISTDGWRNHGGVLASFLKPIVDAVT